MNATTATTTVSVNGKLHPLAGPATLVTLLNELGFAERKGIAIAVNGTVVPRAEWPVRSLAEADRVLVIQATQGG
ncbi:MAG: sulfur carrier protein ThiS [Verrucomicrobiota bacterium]|nr:sulfur carrier protein ThiS [Verrucomicrobiota bacterium]